MNQEFFITMMGTLMPLVITNIAHMVVVKRNSLSSLVIPIHEKALGANKTWRGIFFISVINAPLFALMNFPYSLNLDVGFVFIFAAFGLGTGWVFGLAYALFELPNSWLKRRLGIASGSKSVKGSFFFTLLDKTDSAFGVTLVFCLLNGFTWESFMLFFATASGLHFLFSWILYLRNIKKSF